MNNVGAMTARDGGTRWGQPNAKTEEKLGFLIWGKRESKGRAVKFPFK